MKKSGLFAASVVAASAISASSPSPSSTNFTCNSNQFSSEDKEEHENSANKKSTPSEKFEPRFDGLRFIETLVTAHR